jgi:hypothetical protein
MVALVEATEAAAPSATEAATAASSALIVRHITLLNGHHIAARGTGNRGQSADPNGLLGRQGPPGRALETLRRSGYDANRRCPRQGNAMTLK